MNGGTDMRDLRSTDRYLIDPPVTASFGKLVVSIFDIGLQGIQIEHSGPLKLGSVDRLTITMPAGGESIALMGRVLWSHLSGRPDAKGKFLYRSGLQIIDDSTESKKAIHQLVTQTFAKPDTSSLERKRQHLEDKAKQRAARPIVKPLVIRHEIPSDQLLLVQQARERLRMHPDEAMKWYQRAKYSMPEAGLHGHYRDDILAVWEYLERTIELDTIAKVFDTTKT